MASFLSPLAIIIFAADCNMALVALDSTGHVATIASGSKVGVEQQRRELDAAQTKATTQVIVDATAKKLVRREIKRNYASQPPVLVSDESSEYRLRPGEAPCDPGALAEAQRKLSNVGHPTTAAVLPDSGGDGEDDACAKLAKQLSPTIARGHVIVKDVDGNVSQVPEAEEDTSYFANWQKSKDTHGTVVFAFEALGMGVCLFGVCAIGATRYSQGKQIKKLLEERLASPELQEEVDIQALIAEGASAGKIAEATKKNEELRAKQQAALTSALTS